MQVEYFWKMVKCMENSTLKICPIKRCINYKELSIKLLFLLAAFTSVLIVILIFAFLLREAAPFVKNPGLAALFNDNWYPTSMRQVSFGIFPLVAGSFLVTLLAIVIAIPFGVFGAVYISEIAKASEREVLKPFIELLAGIPSVVLGFFGLVVLAPYVKELFGLSTGLNALNGALLLALMSIPTIISISEDALQSVPKSYKAASLALGASNWETIWKVTVPAAFSGIIAAIMLGMGRVIGETMVVLMVTGNAAMSTLNPLDSVRTLTATIAAEMGEVVQGSSHYQSLFWLGILLLIATFGLNMVALRALKKYRMG